MALKVHCEVTRRDTIRKWWGLIQGRETTQRVYLTREYARHLLTLDHIVSIRVLECRRVLDRLDCSHGTEWVSVRSDGPCTQVWFDDRPEPVPTVWP